MVNANYEPHRNRLIRYSVILLVLSLLAYAVFFSWQSWRHAKSDEVSRLALIAELDEKALDGYFTQLEIAMQGLGMDLIGTRKQPDLERAFALLSRFQKRHTELGNILLLRADGQILLTGTTPYSRELPTLANNQSFMKFRDELQQGQHFVVGQPVIGHIDNSWSIAARHGFSDQSGKLRYILSANLPIDMLQRYWVDAGNPKIATLGLMRDDGHMVSRYPEPDAAQLDVLYGQPLTGAMVDFLKANNFPRYGLVETAGDGSTPALLQLMRRLQHYPLTLFIEIPLSEIKSAWWREVKVPYFLMALMLGGILFGYSRSLRRHHVWSLQQRREESRRNFEQALLDRDLIEVLMFDANTLQLTEANDNAINNLGYSLEEIKSKNLLSLYPELGMEAFATLIGPLRRGEQESVTYQTVQARANGSIYPVEVSLQLVTADDRNEFLALINDITELQQTEENIRHLNAPLERRISGSESGLELPG